MTEIEIVFSVENDRDGGYTAKALNESILTQADNMDSLKKMICDAVNCHFAEEKPITLQFASS